MPEQMTAIPFMDVHRALHYLGYMPTAVESNAEASPTTLRKLSEFGRAEGMTDIAISRQDAIGEVLLIRPKALVDRIRQILSLGDRAWTGQEIAKLIEETFVKAEEFSGRIQRLAAARKLTRKAYDTYLRWLVAQGNLRRSMIEWLDSEGPQALAEAARRANSTPLDFRAALETPFPQTTVERGTLVGGATVGLAAPVAWGIIKLVIAAFALAAVALVVKLAAIIGHHWTVVAEHELRLLEAGMPPEDIIRLRRAREEGGFPWTLALVVIGGLGAGYLLTQWKGREAAA